MGKRRAYRASLAAVTAAAPDEVTTPVPPVECARQDCDRLLHEAGVITSRFGYSPALAARKRFIYCSGLCAMAGANTPATHDRHDDEREPHQWTLARWRRDDLGSHRIVCVDGHDRHWYADHMASAPP